MSKLTSFAPYLLGALFLFSGVLKVFDPAQFTHDIAQFRILPSALNQAIGHGLPWLEILLALALILNCFRRPAAWVLLFLLLAFSAAIGSAWLRGLNIDCGCFGRALPHMDYSLSLLRNALLILLTLPLLLYPTGRLANRLTITWAGK